MKNYFFFFLCVGVNYYERIVEQEKLVMQVLPLGVQGYQRSFVFPFVFQVDSGLRCG